jgi:hypothetical protein
MAVTRSTTNAVEGGSTVGPCAERKRHVPDELSSARPSSLVTVWEWEGEDLVPDKALWNIERNSTQLLPLDRIAAACGVTVASGCPYQELDLVDSPGNRLL